MKGAEKAALQDELKYYTGLLAAHYSSAKIRTQHPNVQSSMARNPAVSASSTFKTTTNHAHHYKSSSFQSRTVTHLPNQNSKAMPSFNLHKKIDLPNKSKVSNSFNLRKYPCKSSMVKINPSSASYKSLNQAEKALDHNILLKKTIPDSKKQINPGVVNKPSGSSSQVLMDEISLLIKQLKQKTKHIDNKMNNVSSKVHSLNKCGPDKPELNATTKIPTDLEIFCSTLNDINQTKDSNSCFFDGKKNSRGNPSDDVNGSLVKPLSELRNNFLPHSNHKMLEIPSKSFNETSENLCAKLENSDVLQVNTVKTPVRKKLIRKRTGSVKKLSGTTLFASKYKVVNKKLPCVQHAPVLKKVTLLSPEVKTPLKIKPVKKHINSGKKIKGGARLITTKYKIINKKLPRIQSLNSENSFQRKSGDNVCKLPIIDKWTSLKTNGTKLKVNKLNSKYKIVNKSEKSATVPMSLFAKKSINIRESKLGNFVHQASKNLNEFSTSNSSRKNIYATSKLYNERKNIKSMALLKQNNLHALNLKRKKHDHSRNSFIPNSKYRTVNKHPSSSLKKISERVKSNLSSDQNSSIDLDLLMELAAEKKEHNDIIIKNSPNKHILIKRVYKSKNAIVNKNICSLQTKAAKMIKTKYSILNKKHSWQKQSFTKRIISPKSFKGQKFNSNYQSKMSFFHSQRNKRNNSRHKTRHHASTYFAGKSYSRGYLVSKNRSSAVGVFQSMVKTPKRFVLNRKVYLKTPNTMKSVVPVSKTMASRALNRSINRVLSASIKKKTSKVNIYCMFYNRFGRCNKGIKCPYVHDPSKIAVCTRFLRGTCKNENCPFSHEICPGKMAICSFFLLGSCTKIDCPYRHETLSPNAKLCKAFVQGYCPDGKQCKQAHVLVCPQFVQGHCEKGNACPFPHPPPKEKKTIPNSIEKSENLEETEEQILEKMSRYFECADESVTNDECSITVPRIRNLPEQPSFIAL
ncbi:Zinc finger CCCH domain-containing protein 3 [Araneus ventricosus]|uniref:Zinc finger CCCH domain-containing protein 3 n=1 Tax=Araneus ventricosus TaxID=182803 RepID=A0A4Y2CEU7_ARAVE|nr:Zinc finger CCCH domain-containing protein 3 [Araneus ventricosus]